MKGRMKKRINKITAAALACAAAAGIFLQMTAVSVQAAANSMPGIDIIVNGNSSEKPFRILELTDSSENAEIGYYVSGQEPSIKLYTYKDENGKVIHFSTLEEGLSQLPEKERKEFAMNVKVDDNGNIDTNNSTGISKVEMKKTTETEAPLSYNEYKEKYFLENGDNENDWTKIEFKDSEGNGRVDNIEANGSYVENKEGTGDYSKEEQQYYPIRKNADSDSQQPELFRENIENFSYIEDEEQRSAYFLEFAEISNDGVNKAFSDDSDEAKSAQEKIQAEYDYQNGRYGYYENVYTDLTEDIVKGIDAGKYSFPGEKTDDSAVTGNGSNALLIQDNSAVVDGTVSGDNRAPIEGGGINNQQTAGTQENPYIYLGDNIDQYPYYQYTLVGDLEYVKASVKDMTAADYKPEAGDIVMDDGQYWYLVQDPDHDDQLIQTELSIVSGRQPVAYEDISKIPENFNYNYYYVVKKAWFCCELSSGGSETNPSDYQFFGWYYPSYPNGEDIYVPAGDKVPTYYISAAQYTLTPGTGDYDFVPGGNQTRLVQVDHMYYQGGYENHDWLKKYVFHLEKEKYNGFNVQVDTRYANDVTKPVHANVDENDETAVDDTDVTSYDLVYVNGQISDTVAQQIADAGVPCIVNVSHVTSVPDAFSAYINNADDDDNYVTQQMYFFKGTATAGEGLVNDNFAKEFSEAQKTGFGEITEYIEKENRYRNLDQNLEPLSESLSQARVIEYIINYQYKRNTAIKDKVNVLQIMPDIGCAEISENDIYQWLGYDSGSSEVTVEGCSEETDNEASNVLNADTSKIWHSSWTGGDTHQGNHYLKVNFKTPQNIEGIVYTPRGASINGVLIEYTIEAYDAKGNILKSQDGRTNYTSSRYSGDTTINFGETVSNVSQIKLIFKKALDNTSNQSDKTSTKFASCAQLQIVYADRAKVTACCEQTWTAKDPHDYLASYMTDSDTSNYWHSKYSDENGNENSWLGQNHVNQGPENRMHYIEVDFTDPENVGGFTYTPRGDSMNGTLQTYIAEFYNKNGGRIDRIEGDTGYTTQNYKGAKTIKFDHNVSNVSKMYIYFERSLEKTHSNQEISSKNFATCKEFGIVYAEDERTEVNLTTMTASEFVGHIDDIASEYDMIYISGAKVKRNNDNNNNQALTTGDGELRYTHVGNGKQIYSRADASASGLLKLLGQLDIEYDNWTGSDGKTRRFAPINTYGPNGGGYFRGSGNDMTSQQCEKLLNFVKSGYPVIVSDQLLTDEKVNTNRVDNASYYYEFLSQALGYDNVMSTLKLNSGKSNLLFFANLAKPVIKFAENGKPPEPPRLDETAAENADYVDGELKYVFTVENDSDAAPASTTYDCQLYLDLNFDGNLSSTEEQEKYITIQDEDGNVMSQTTYGDGDLRYELQAGRQYTLTRKLPKDYYKIITWKLEISSNTNNYIHTSEIGYAKQKNKTGIKQKIKVLQLLPKQSFSDGANSAQGGNWVLNKKNSTFQKLISQVEDFDIQIDVIYVTNPTGGNYPTDVAHMSDGEMKQKLKDYQMLVIGFNDVYPDIPNDKHQVDDILDFIKSGKSVLFSHDTTSYVNYDKNYMYNKIADTAYGKDENTPIYSDGWLYARNPTWGLSLNTTLRSIVGMDRYGITSDEKMNGQTVSSLLKKGKALNSNSVSFKELMQLAGDVAWATNDGRSSSYGQTQAYTNNMLNGINIGSNQTTQAKRVNDGAITQYPYRMSNLESKDSQILSIAQTHGQYYQLALEQDRDVNGRSDGESDIVVWYCLTGSVYSDSPNDARNNYYFYSKGNVIYTGAGHKLVDNGNNSGEMKLFINAMVAAANVTAVDPEINFVDELNPTADIESTRYYATDQSSWTDDNEANVLEKSMDFYVNVKDYNMVSADLNQDDLDKQEMTLQFYIDSDSGSHVDGAPGSSGMTDITNVIGSLTDYDGKTVNVGDYGSFHLKENNAFKLTLSNPEQYLRTAGSATSGDKNGYRKDCKLYVKVTSTVYLYGEPKVSTKWATIDLKQRQLFELN